MFSVYMIFMLNGNSWPANYIFLAMNNERGLVIIKPFIVNDSKPLSFGDVLG